MLLISACVTRLQFNSPAEANSVRHAASDCSATGQLSLLIARSLDSPACLIAGTRAAQPPDRTVAGQPSLLGRSYPGSLASQSRDRAHAVIRPLSVRRVNGDQDQGVLANGLCNLFVDNMKLVENKVEAGFAFCRCHVICWARVITTFIMSSYATLKALS